MNIQQLIVNNLEENKAQDIISLDIRKLTDIADYMIIASGTSTRHLKSLAKHVVDNLKENGYSILGIEGEKESEWILIDAESVIINLMLPETRKFYELEKLWNGETY